MKSARSLLRQCIAYICIVGVAITGIFFGSIGAALVLITAMNPVPEISLGDQDEQTQLDQKIADAREIRESLARQFPPLAPLPRITARAHSAELHARASAPQSASIYRSRMQAREAFARIPLANSTPQVNSYAEADRHAVR